MQTIFRYTKFKVIAGYILLFVLSITAIILTYRQIIRMEVEEQGGSTANRKLYIIGNTIAGLYEAETLNNAFLQTNSDHSFKRYISIMEQVNANIDSLKQLTNQREQHIRLDSVILLLEEKTENLKALVQAKKSFTPDAFYHKVITNIQSSKDSVQKYKDVRHRMVTTHDSSFIKTDKKRRNFWNWLTAKPKADSVLQVTVSRHSIVDTLNRFIPGQNTDTVVNMLKSAWEQIQQKNEDITRKISHTEYNIIDQSTHITEQLRRILGEYEKEELYHSFRKIELRERVVNATTRNIAWIAAGSILLILLFIFFILRDISRSQRYRKKLETAQKYTDQLLESREKLMLTVTHDIKSPLGSIIGYIELLHNTPIDERQRYFLKNMKSSSEHILRLVTNLLDFSKLENNQMPVEEIIFNPMQLFNEINDSFIPLAKDKHLDLIRRIDEELDCVCKGDALRIRQILANLISNAIKYTAKGTVNFIATTSSAGQDILLQIKDTGSGMTSGEQKTIFNEFTRLASTAKTEGTGLGLTITLKLIQLLKGEIGIESNPGEGSCFTVRLPLKRIVRQTEAQRTEKPALSALSRKKLTVLLVDDDMLQLEMSAGLLQNNGMQTDITTHPEEVVTKLQNGQYDLICSDIQMPGMDGFELADKIRTSALPFARTIPIIALSANAIKNEADYKKAGFTSYLSKPFSATQLIDLIDKITGAPQTEISQNQTEKTEDISATTGYTLKNIRQFADGDQMAMQKIIDSFTEETGRNTTLLKTYIETKQTEQVKKLAHKMLPMFRQLEAKECTEVLQSLEGSDKQTITENEMWRLSGQVILLSEELIQRLKK